MQCVKDNERIFGKNSFEAPFWEEYQSGYALRRFRTGNFTENLFGQLDDRGLVGLRAF